MVRRFSRRIAAVVAVTIALFFLYHLYSLHSYNLSLLPTALQQQQKPQPQPQPPQQPPPPPPPQSDDADTRNPPTTTESENAGEPDPFCPPLPGIEHMLVVMKTGATESREKVPIHFTTTLRCIPNYMIVSDFEEEIEGVKIHDVLRTMSPEVRERVPDFDIYNRILSAGRQGLQQQDFAGEAEENSAIGKPMNRGWKLDKWKFLPMAQEALRYKPDATWYFFMEADTYVSWPTLLAWLAKFNPLEPHYIGTETQIADVIFAHGGSGFVLSKPALQRASDQYTARTAELNEYTDQHWAGDCVLGKVLADAGVGLHFSWPILQNSNLGELDEFTNHFYRQPWCFPAVALHHLSPQEIENLWNLEQKRWHDKNKLILLHGQLFREHLYPELASQPIRLNWDNLSDEEQPFANNLEDCRDICDAQRTCVQFAFRDGTCFTGVNPRLGVAHTGAFTSGWLINRIRDLMDQKGLCPAPDFGEP